jgi:hypothetical protein
MTPNENNKNIRNIFFILHLPPLTGSWLEKSLLKIQNPTSFEKWDLGFKPF